MKRPYPWDEQISAAENARRVLPALTARFFRDGRRALRLNNARRLHDFRLQAKHFRYTLEIFVPVYGPGLGRRIRLLRQLQTFLGDVSDTRAVGELLDGFPKRLYPEAKGMREWLHQRRAQQTASFRRFWKESFDAPGQEAAWRRYLSRTRVGRQPAPASAATPEPAPAATRERQA